MKFDLFDAMAILKKNFGDDSEMLIRNHEHGVAIRLSVMRDEIFHNYEFMISNGEIDNNDFVNKGNFHFHRGITSLKKSLE